MPRSNSGPRKRRTREHIIADLSINHVERQILRRGFTMERWLHDYGIDLVLSTYTDEGETEPGLITIQVKATDRLNLVSEGRAVSVRIERADLRAWLTDPLPVILIVYDARNDVAYWLYVQAAFTGAARFRAARGSETLTVRIPTTQILDPAAVEKFRAFRDRILAQNEGVIHCD